MTGNDSTATPAEDTSAGAGGAAQDDLTRWPGTAALGTAVKLPTSGRVNVTRPDGETITVTGGWYLVQQRGTYTVGTRKQHKIEVD